MTPNNTAAVLLSRQPLRPTGVTGWVRQAGLAVRLIKDRGMALCSSVGMQTWEMLTSLAVIEGVPLKLVLPYNHNISFDRQCHQALRQFRLKDHPVSFVQTLVPEGKTRKNEILRLRDLTVVESADTLLPVSIRDDGGMNDLILGAEADGAAVDRRFETPFTDRSEPLAYGIDPQQLRKELDDLAVPYLIHWTRTTNRAWPNELLLDYYRAIITSEKYPRSALATLQHILQSRKLVASAKNMPGNVATVSLSSLRPSELIPLMKWRARFRQMSFEPYGVGIRIPVAERLGVRPVHYYKKPLRRGDIPEPLWLSQSAGDVTDWRYEKEYRHLGDLDLAQIDNGDLCAFCLTPEEAASVEDCTGVRIVSFYRA